MNVYCWLEKCRLKSCDSFATKSGGGKEEKGDDDGGEKAAAWKKTASE